MGGYGVVIGGSMGAITRSDHGVALRGVYAVEIGWSMAITRCDHGVALRGVYGGVYGCNHTV